MKSKFEWFCQSEEMPNLKIKYLTNYYKLYVYVLCTCMYNGINFIANNST